MSDDIASLLLRTLSIVTGAESVSPEWYDALDRPDVTAAQRAEIAEGVRRASAELTRLRRREHELGVLFTSARELAESRDVDALLGRLVDRAHELLGGDITYLSAFDPETRELHVRTSLGAVTPEFQQLVVPPGKGLASQIADTRAPGRLLRYEEYPSERHESAIDDAVSGEGIVSILGVPMLSGDTVLGVLFAATRHEYDFSAEQIALLSSLADHASIVLQNAANLDRLRASEDEARSALNSLVAHVESRDRSNVVHQNLIHTVLAGGGFDEVAATLAQALGRSVTIIDELGRIIAGDGTERAAQRMPQAATQAVATSRATGRSVTIETGETDVVAAVIAGESHLGTILVGRGEAALDAVDVRTIERAAQVAALLTLQQNAVADADRRAQDEFVSDLLDARPERLADLERRARSHDTALASLDSLVLVSVPGERRMITSRALRQQLGSFSLIGERGGLIVVLTNGERVSDGLNIRRIAHDASGGPVLTIAAPPASGVLDLAERYETASRTARLLVALGVDDAEIHTDEYLPYSVVFDTDARALQGFLESTIGAVRAYDARRGTELLQTLRAFVRNDASPTRTARALNYHTNTILQRLERLTSVLGPDWRDDEQLFRLSTALRLDELREKHSR